MSTLQQSVIRYCEKHGIVWQWEDQWTLEFIAPSGRVFPNESRYRYIEEPDLRTASDLIGCLSLEQQEQARHA